MKVRIVQPVLNGNDRIAGELRDRFRRDSVFAFNVISSPGAGKTTFLEGVVDGLRRQMRVAVIVGDIEDTVDARRLSKEGVTAVQLNTRGACHLDASMVREGLSALDGECDLLVIENVGNLVCPGDFDLGEDMKVVILSTTEGDDKPNKYPGTFRRAQAVVINKTDLLPFTNFDMEKARRDIGALNPSARLFEVAATRPETLVPFIRFVGDAVRWKKNGGR